LTTIKHPRSPHRVPSDRAGIVRTGGDNPHGEVVKSHEAPVDASFYVLEGSPAVEIESVPVAAATGTLIPSTAIHLHSIRNESVGLVRSSSSRRRTRPPDRRRRGLLGGRRSAGRRASFYPAWCR